MEIKLRSRAGKPKTLRTKSLKILKEMEKAWKANRGRESQSLKCKDSCEIQQLIWNNASRTYYLLYHLCLSEHFWSNIVLSLLFLVLPGVVSDFCFLCSSIHFLSSFSSPTLIVCLALLFHLLFHVCCKFSGVLVSLLQVCREPWITQPWSKKWGDLSDSIQINE